MKKLTFLLATFLMASYANAQVVFGENEKEYVKSTSFSSGRQPKKDAKPYLSGQEKFKLWRQLVWLCKGRHVNFHRCSCRMYRFLWSYMPNDACQFR